jgi:hypothetical protein
MKLDDKPGVHVLDWKENRQRRKESSRYFPLGPSQEKDRPLWNQVNRQPGNVAPAHSHAGWTCTVVLEGSLSLDGVEFGPGQMILVEPHVHYGPLIAGPTGVSFIEFYENQGTLAPIWDMTDPAVVALLERLGDEAASVNNPAIAVVEKHHPSTASRQRDDGGRRGDTSD